jgi:NADH-quinone oxidoreductase subunit J
LAVTARKIFRSAVWLLLSLMGVAGLYFWMDVNFIAAVQLVVYAGGIVVLIIFSIFLTQQAGNNMPAPPKGRVAAALVAVLIGAVFTGRLLYHTVFAPPAKIAFSAEPSAIGLQLLSTTNFGYVLPFEAVSMLLLAAMTGCIVIAMKEKKI